MQNICIFGSSGFIGSYYIRKYKNNITRPIIIHKFDITGKDFRFIDVRNKIEIKDSFNPSDVIINLAAVHKTPGHLDHEYFETNIKGAENVCAFAEEKGINNIIFTSSIAPYGASEDLKLEKTLTTPNTPYGISKLVAEHVHKTWQARDINNRKLLIIRPGVVFGKGENGNYTRLYKALRTKRFFYPGRKDTVKACIYVKDLVDLSLDIFESYNSGTKTYNFTYEPAPTIKEIVDTISTVTKVLNPKLVLNGQILKAVALVLGSIGFKKYGIHPDRVKKLMTSTNISGEKLITDNFKPKYNLEKAISDWFKDCNEKGLF